MIPTFADWFTLTHLKKQSSYKEMKSVLVLFIPKKWKSKQYERLIAIMPFCDYFKLSFATYKHNTFSNILYKCPSFFSIK